MALPLSDRALLLSQKQVIEQQIILEIDGIDQIFGAVPITTDLVYGSPGVDYGDGDFYGGVVENPNNLDWISLKGTTNNIKQQLLQDKGGGGGAGAFKVRIIDKDTFLTALFQPGINIPDLLGSKARVYASFVGGSHPKDSVRLFNGVINSYSFGAGYIDINVAASEKLKQKEIFIKIDGELSSDIDDSVTTIPLKDASEFLLPTDILRTYVVINDEIIEYTGISSNDLTGGVRGSLNTIAASHSEDDNLESFYRLESPMIALALKIMMSNGPEFYATRAAERFNQVEPATFVENGIFFEDFNIQETTGAVVGDLLTVTGATNPANNVTDAVITSFGTTATGSFVVLGAESLVTETGSSATASFKSQFNVLPDGCGMTPDEVDVAQHLLIQDVFNSSFADYDIYIKNSLDANSFINTELYYPHGCYQVPRKARASLNITIPPLADTGTKVLNLDNVVNPNSITISRSVDRNFYNSVVYKYDQDSLTDKFLAGKITTSEDSFNRIETQAKPLTIESRGLRRNADVDNLIDIQSRRFLDRYQFGAEVINRIRTNYKTGFTMEIGDSVIVDGSELQISDSRTGTRNFSPRIMEVTNKSLNLKTGAVDLQLTDTAFNIDGRFGTISPSSFINSGATTTRIPLKKSFSTGEFEDERTKWEDYLQRKVLVHNDDYSTVETTTLVGIDAVSVDTLIVSPALSGAPSEDDIVEVDFYPNTTDPRDNEFLKAIHIFQNPQVAVVSGASDTVFDVGAGDIGKFLVGSIVRVHNEDYTVDSPETVVTDITVNTITVEDSLGFTPSSSELVDLIGFIDGGLPYRYI